MKYKLIIFLSITITVFSIEKSYTQELDHEIWNQLLKKYVSENGTVTYSNFDEDLLNTYLKELETNQPNDSWSKNKVLSYWINAYNAFTIKLILKNFPLNSIKDIKDPWNQKFIPLKDEQLISLNDIEHRILRKMNEPRIHFGINCASISCPKLLNEAFTSKNVDLQLNKASLDFINDKSKNNISTYRIVVSPIFDWFKEDFTKNQTLIEFLNKYSDTTINEHATLSYLKYNWNINGK
ncbi:DUF547 domain-containing protein [Joostella atrarenae]|uniref:DUF547 domain-containing protein n=1 Tax=Joostella atrarenae TaxID=679257 RepID=A0ABS9IZ38_9FLAO|nr:DUF547 domain-containing protein [Joostella atrarenae]MCF8713368.1 DUF547 domain-containing protein [Joostella atrarenae]